MKKYKHLIVTLELEFFSTKSGMQPSFGFVLSQVMIYLSHVNGYSKGEYIFGRGKSP